MAAPDRRSLFLRVLGSALTLALASALGGGALGARAAAPKPGPSRLPAVQLRVELRSVALPAAGPRPGEPLKPGAVVVGTAGRIDPNPGTTLRTGTRPAEAAAVLQVLVANGERAVLRWQDEQVIPQVEFIWTPQGQGVTGGERVRLASRQLSVLPAWAAEGEPVRLEIALDPGPERGLAAQTVARVPLAHWQAIARSAEPAPHGGSSAGAGGVELQVRVTLAGP